MDLLIGELVLPGVRIAGSSGLQEALLGRDVLNKLMIVLDGPQGETSILDQSEAQRFRVKH